MSLQPSYTEEQKSIVRQVWAFRANRKANETERLLKSDEFQELGLSQLTSRSIRNWSEAEDWDSKANEELYEGATSLRYLAQSEIRLAVPEAARFLRQALEVAAKNMMRPIRDKNGASVLGDDGEPVIELDVNVLKAGISAAQLLMDRGGFSPIGLRELGEIDAPPTAKSSLVAEIQKITDLDTLRELEAVARGQSGIGVRA